MIAPWIDVADLEESNQASPYAEEAVASASFVLYLLSGRKYSGVSSTTETYCQMGVREVGTDYRLATLLSGSLAGSGSAQVWPLLHDGTLTNQLLGDGCCSSCGCPHIVRLRGAPVLSVESVYDDGREISLDDVAIFDHSYITAPTKCWRSCGELEVTYTYGAPPPAMGKAAARELANQYILAMTDDDNCALPQRVTQVSRQGVSWTLLDPQDFLDKGLTGIYSIDLFLRAVNPDKARMRARVFSPDIRRGKTRRPAVAVGPQVAPALMSAAGVRAFGLVPTTTSAPTPASTPEPVARTVMAPMVTTETLPTEAPVPAGVLLYEGRPLRWVVPGPFGVDQPPVVTVQPSGKEVPPDALLWRTSNYTVDLTAEQVEQLLPPGSVLVVSAQADDGSTTATSSHPVERSTP